MGRVTEAMAVTAVNGMYMGVVIAALYLGGAPPSRAAAAPATPNIALHRPYTWSRAPNYGLCRDDGDSTQLTDGAVGHDGEALWRQRSTVGWVRPGGPVSITIDLGAVHPIGGLSFRSTGGSSAVAFPAFIVVWLSDDGATFRHRGELLALSWRRGLPDASASPHAPRSFPVGVHRYLVKGVTWRGRFVKLSAYPGSGYLFCDEIEVFAGDGDADVEPPGTAELEEGFESWVTEHKHHPIAQVRMLYDLQELQGHPMVGHFGAEITAQRQAVLAMPMFTGLTMANGLPYTPLHARIWALHGAMARRAGHEAFRIWQARPYAPLHPFDPPPPPGADTTAEVHMLGNERRPLACNVTNYDAGDGAVDVRFEWGDTASPAEAVTLRTVRYVETQERFVLASALPEVAPLSTNAWSVTVPAGVVSQWWFTIDSGDMPRGVYAATVRCRAAGRALQALPLRVHVHAGRMPDVPTLDAITWDYLHVPGRGLITHANRDAALRLLRSCGVTSHWVDTHHSPHGGDRLADGTWVSLSNLERFDAWLAAVRPARRFYVYLHIDAHLERYSGGHEPGGAAYRRAVASYFRLLAAHVEAKGLARRQFVFLVTDEPTGGAGDQVAAEFIGVARAAVPGFLFFEDPLYREMAGVNQALMAASDIVCPKWSTFEDPALRAYYRRLATEDGKVLGGFQCTDGGWLRDPTAYFRKMAWQAWDVGGSVIGVWAYMAAHEPDTWDDFRAGPGWHMAFATPQTVTGSKALAAYGEGIADYQYFCILRDLVQGAAARPAVDEARAMLNGLAARVLAELGAAPPSERGDVVERARRQLLDRIDAIADGVGGQRE